MQPASTWLSLEPCRRWGGVPLKDAIRGKHKEVQALLRKAGAKSWVPEKKNGDQGKRSGGISMMMAIKLQSKFKALKEAFVERKKVGR